MTLSASDQGLTSYARPQARVVTQGPRSEPMPYVIRKDGDQWCVHKRDGGAKVACHDTEEEAKRHMAALYANVPDAGKAEVYLHFGPAVKALGDGKVGGYLIQFGDEATKDADGEWFTSETDFDQEFPSRASIYYNHGLDPQIGRRRLGHGTMKSDDLGVWVEAQLDLHDKYQAAMYAMAKAGKLGWSSGSLSHITDPPREAPGGAIKSWPLGHDASLTPIPSDRRNLAVALKAWDPPTLEDLMETAGGPGHRSLAENTERWLDYGLEVLAGYAAIAGKSGRKLSAPRRARLEEMAKMIRDLLDETAPRDEAAAAASTPAPGTGSGEEALPEASARPTAGTAARLPDLNDVYAARLRQAGVGLSPGSS